MSQIDRTDGLVGNAAIKYPCRMASTANLVLSGLQTIDAVVGAQDDRVLVKNQTTGTQNGIYVMDSGSWERAQDADNDGAFTEGSLVKVNNGTVGVGFWYVTNTGTITIDSTAITFAQASGTLAFISAAWQAVVSLATIALGLTQAGFSAFVQTLLAAATSLAFRQLLILDKHGADIASAATPNLDTATGDVIDITGAVNITGFTLTDGVEKTVRFTGAPTLTHSATLILPGSANIVAAAGDYAVFRGYAAGVVRCVSYQRIAAEPLALTTQALQEAASSNVVAVTPGRQQYHPSAAKFFLKCNVAGSINVSYNVTSISDVGTGSVGVSFTTAFSTADYAILATVMGNTAGQNAQVTNAGQNAGSIANVLCFTAGAPATAADPTSYYVAGFGDQ